MKQKIQFSSPLWGLIFLYPYVLLLTCCWKAGTFRPGGSIIWQKFVCAFALSGSDGKFHNVWWCGTIVVSVSSDCVCFISRGGHTVFHVSLVRLSLAGLAASTELRRAAQQGHHSPPTNPAPVPLSPADSLLAWLPVTQIGVKWSWNTLSLWGKSGCFS